MYTFHFMAAAGPFRDVTKRAAFISEAGPSRDVTRRAAFQCMHLHTYVYEYMHICTHLILFLKLAHFVTSRNGPLSNVHMYMHMSHTVCICIHTYMYTFNFMPEACLLRDVTKRAASQCIHILHTYTYTYY